MKFEAQAPSNIALIKYMGKSDAQSNRPLNASLSYSLENLVSQVEVELIRDSSELKTHWQPLENTDLKLSDKGQKKYLSHFENLCKQIGLSGEYVIRSKNNFPASCGLASSASSFAALTKCFATLAREVKGVEYSPEQLSALSQKGSGSSSRSLFSGWSIWEDEGAKSIDLPLQNLVHDVVLVESGEKEVSSSEAHKRVLTSLNYEGRTQRAQKRLDELLEALKRQDWKLCYQICWEEFWDMHSLFETSRPAFGYLTADSLAVLDLIRQMWNRDDNGPLVTMDAGPNVHLLWRDDQTTVRVRLKQILNVNGFKIWHQD